MQKLQTKNQESVKTVLKARPDWMQLRCQTCHGLGLVAAYTVYRRLDDDVVNGEEVGDRICRDCHGAGVPESTLHLFEHIQTLSVLCICGHPRALHGDGGTCACDCEGFVVLQENE